MMIYFLSRKPGDGYPLLAALARYQSPFFSCRAFTLIELLIVVAIMTILFSGFGTFTIKMMHERKDGQRQMALQAEVQQALESLLHDLGKAQRVHLEQGPVLSLEWKDLEDNQTRRLNVTYRLSGRDFLRTVRTEDGQEFTQYLARNIESLNIERLENGLCRLSVFCLSRAGKLKTYEKRLVTEVFIGERWI